MRRRTLPSTDAARISALLLAGLVACDRPPEPDAFGNFEATEVVVAAQTAGQVREFVPVEGATLAEGAAVVLIDTVQLALERAQLEAQRSAVGSRRGEVSEQLHVLEVQRDIALRNYERTQRLHARQAATAQQLDQAEREYRVLVAQIGALQAQRSSVGLDVASSAARIAQVNDRIAKSRVTNPGPGTVLAVYARVGEVVQPGQPLYKIARLDTLDFRAWLTGAQLASVRLGQEVQVRVDAGDGGLRTLPGRVSWIAPNAEFTPTPVQTRDDRADLVYAMKVRVANPDGRLRIGMPGDITFARAAADTGQP